MTQRVPGPILVETMPPEWIGVPAGAVLVRRARAVRRGVAVLLFTVLAGLVQAACLLAPGRAKVVVARWYWAGVCRLLGLRVQVLGTPARQMAGGRPLVFASNHSSWLDVPVAGGTLEACFVAKAEVGRWPVVATVARLGRTVFVSRQSRAVGRERDAMRARLAAGDNLILFPEGTSSDGSRVLPFRSTFFSVVDVVGGGAGDDEAGAARRPMIQPVSIVYDRLGGLPIGRASRAVFAWYGDMELGSHFWRLAQEQGLRATVLLHPPVDPADYPSRKVLSHAVWTTVAAGAAALRQNRPADPAAHMAAAGHEETGTDPAFA